MLGGAPYPFNAAFLPGRTSPESDVRAVDTALGHALPSHAAMAVKRRPVKNAAHSAGAKRVVPGKAKGKTVAAGRVRTAAKRRPSALKTKAKVAGTKPSLKAKATAPASAKAKAPARAATPMPKSRAGKSRAPVPETRASAVPTEVIPSAQVAVAQPAATLVPSTTAREENGTPGLPVPIASFTI